MKLQSEARVATETTEGQRAVDLSLQPSEPKQINKTTFDILWDWNNMYRLTSRTIAPLLDISDVCECVCVCVYVAILVLVHLVSTA